MHSNFMIVRDVKMMYVLCLFMGKQTFLRVIGLPERIIWFNNCIFLDELSMPNEPEDLSTCQSKCTVPFLYST